MKKHYHYILFHKPYGVLSQFTHEGGKPGLSSFGPFPPDVYAAGRLDADSEGLLFLTNDNEVKHRLTDPKYSHPRTYLAQVEGIPSPHALQRLRDGIVIQGRKMLPAKATLLSFEPPFPPRSVPIRFRKNIPTSWIKITLREGRNRQVRRMTAAIGHPTLRLIRTNIIHLGIDCLLAGEHRNLRQNEIEELRKALKRQS